jgi:glycosyltransferase involved in cell wall biosynthesis
MTNPMRSECAAPRVLFLATYFPKPGIDLMGVWALAQAHALGRAGSEVTVASLTPWLPRALGRLARDAPATQWWKAGLAHRLRRAGVWAAAPPTHRWGELRADYPRWLHYPQLEPLRRRAYRDPGAQLALAWRSARRALDRLVEETRPEVIFAHHTAINGYVALRLAERHGLPFVTADHDFGEVTDAERLPGRRRIFEAVAARAATMVAVAERMERDLRRLVPSARIVTVHNGADQPPARLWSVPRPRELDGRTVVFTASNFYVRKGIPGLVEAFARVAGRHPDAVLRIAGDGPDSDAVDAAVAAAGLGERIVRLGLLDHDAVLQELVWADVFALTGWDEPWGVIYTEAMAAGTPLVWSTGGGIDDVLEDGIHGRGVPPRNLAAAADALDELLGDGVARRTMGAAARELFEGRLTWDANASEMLRILGAATGRPLAAPAR